MVNLVVRINEIVGQPAAHFTTGAEEGYGFHFSCSVRLLAGFAPIRRQRIPVSESLDYPQRWSQAQCPSGAPAAGPRDRPQCSNAPARNADLPTRRMAA